METRRELRQAARELMEHEQLAPSKAIVDLLDEEPLEVEIATTLALRTLLTILTGRFGKPCRWRASGGAGRSSTWDCGIAAGMTR